MASVVSVVPAAPSESPEAREATERELAERLRSGDAVAFEVLFRRYYRRLQSFAAGYVRSAEAAEDLTVDVFVRIWERRAEWTLQGSLRSYLYSAVRNEALAHLRRQQMVQRAHADAERDARHPGMGTPPPAADDDVEMHELTEKVQQAIAHLPDRTRQALVLHRQHGLSYAEVAAAMGISPRTVEVHIRRAFQALRISLDGLLLSLLLSVLLR